MERRQNSKIEEVQASESLTQASSRGFTSLERKSAWPFDFYQAGAFYPIDYHYYSAPFQTMTGPSALVVMHAVAYANDGSEFGADQLEYRESIRQSSKRAIRDYQRAVAAAVRRRPVL